MDEHDDLINEVEQFLSEGGEQPDGEALFEELRDQAGNADATVAWYGNLSEEEQRVLLATTQARMDELQRILEPVITAIMEFTKAVVEAMTPLVEAFVEVAETVNRAIRQSVQLYQERLQRAVLVHQLRRWRIPWLLAVWIAKWWPQRWLPVLATPPPNLLY